MESGFTSDTFEYSDSTWQRIPHRGSGRFEFFRVRLFGAMHFVKRPSPSYAHDLQTTESLRKEFNIGYNLSHPGIVKYLRMENGAVFQEYVDGLSLQQMMEQGDERLRSPRFLERMCCQLLEATGYLHSHGVVHNDIKPENVMITRIGDQVKLVDLGCASSDMWDATEGFTPEYKAPEQGTGNTNVYTDIYLIGKLIELLAQIAGVQHKWRRFVRKATAEATEVRFASDKDALAAITKNHHSRWRGWAVALGCLVVTVAGIYFSMSRREAVEYVSEDGTLDSLRIENHPTSQSYAAPETKSASLAEPSGIVSSSDPTVDVEEPVAELADSYTPDNAETLSDIETVPKNTDNSHLPVAASGIHTSVSGLLDTDLRSKPEFRETADFTESQGKPSLQQLTTMMDKYIKQQYEQRLLPDYRKFGAMPWTYDKCRLDLKLNEKWDKVVKDVTGYVERLAARYEKQSGEILQRGYAIVEREQLRATVIKYPKGEEVEVRDMYAKLNRDSLYNIYYKNYYP